MQVNGVSQRYHVTGLAVGGIGPEDSTNTTITIPQGGLVPGSSVQVVPEVDNPVGVITTGRVADSTHIVIRRSNITTGSITLGIITVDIFVTPPTGEQTDVVIV